MNKREVASLVFRVLAVFYFINSLHGGATWVTDSFMNRNPVGNAPSFLVASAVGILIYLGLAVWLWVGSNAWARTVFPESAEPETPIHVAPRELQTVLLSVLGAYYVFRTLPNVAYYAATAAYRFAQFDTSVRPLPRALTDLGLLLVGLWLMLGARGISRFI